MGKPTQEVRTGICAPSPACTSVRGTPLPGEVPGRRGLGSGVWAEEERQSSLPDGEAPVGGQVSSCTHLLSLGPTSESQTVSLLLCPQSAPVIAVQLGPRCGSACLRTPCLVS